MHQDSLLFYTLTLLHATHTLVFDIYAAGAQLKMCPQGHQSVKIGFCSEHHSASSSAGLEHVWKCGQDLPAQRRSPQCDHLQQTEKEASETCWTSELCLVASLAIGRSCLTPAVLHLLWCFSRFFSWNHQTFLEQLLLLHLASADALVQSSSGSCAGCLWTAVHPKRQALHSKGLSGQQGEMYLPLVRLEGLFQCC